jgi:ABC-2 type transport system ATP-binding protein
MSENVLISVRNLSRYYGKLCAVKNINFEIKRGQIIGFLGANGAGKSTTMQIISGCLAPSSGQIIINGYNLHEKPLKAKAAIGYLAEYPPLYQDMRVADFLYFCAHLHGIKKNQRYPAVQKVMQRCNLIGVQKHLINTLSKGFQQRVGIAQAIIHEPLVVILDEPTIGLDPIQLREIRNLIVDLSREHSVILSTHILSEVQAICTHVQIINHGELVFNDEIGNLPSDKILNLGLSNPPEISELLSISGVETINKVSANYFKISYIDEKNTIENLVKSSVQNNWGLYELISKQRSLEQQLLNLITDVSL